MMHASVGTTLPAPRHSRGSCLRTAILSALAGALLLAGCVDPPKLVVGVEQIRAPAVPLGNVLVIEGDATDTLHLSTGDHWYAPETTMMPGYAIYSSPDGPGIIAVNTDITVTVS